MVPAQLTSPAQVELVPIESLRISELNPRREKKLDQVELDNLADSILANGILQPLVVRRAGKTLEVIAGRRRLEAARLVGLTEVPAIVRELDDEAAASAALVENEQRAALRPLDSALAIARRLDAGESVEQIAAALGKPPGWVARRANLRNLPPAIRKRLETPGDVLREWPVAVLDLLALLPPEDQLERIELAQWDGVPALKDLKEALACGSHRLAVAPWGLDDAELVPAAGACSTCPYNSANSSNLFGDLELDEKKAAGAVCRQAECWSGKLEAFKKVRQEAAQAEHGGKLLQVQSAQHVSELMAPAEQRRNALDHWEYQRVKKGTPGAQPALVVDGKDVGKVVHVKVKAARSPAAKAAKQKPKPGSAAAVKASTERLERRRRAWQVDRALQDLCGITPPAAEELVRLAAMFGTGAIYRGTGAPARSLTLLKLTKTYGTLGPTELWASVVTERGGVRDQLAQRRQYDLDGAHALVKWLLCRFGSIEAWHAIEAASVEEIPAPKSLQGLKQTATAKEKPAAARGAKKAPAKKRAKRGGKA